MVLFVVPGSYWEFNLTLEIFELFNYTEYLVWNIQYDSPRQLDGIFDGYTW